MLNEIMSAFGALQTPATNVFNWLRGLEAYKNLPLTPKPQQAF